LLSRGTATTPVGTGSRVFLARSPQDAACGTFSTTLGSPQRERAQVVGNGFDVLLGLALCLHGVDPAAYVKLRRSPDRALVRVRRLSISSSYPRLSPTVMVVHAMLQLADYDPTVLLESNTHRTSFIPSPQVPSSLFLLSLSAPTHAPEHEKARACLHRAR